MPYRRLEDLPSNVVDPLPKAAQKMWLEAFNSAFSTCTNSGKSSRDCEDVARIAAWVKIKTKYKKGPDGNWKPKGD